MAAQGTKLRADVGGSEPTPKPSQRHPGPAKSGRQTECLYGHGLPYRLGDRKTAPHRSPPRAPSGKGIRAHRAELRHPAKTEPWIAAGEGQDNSPNPLNPSWSLAQEWLSAPSTDRPATATGRTPTIAPVQAGGPSVSPVHPEKQADPGRNRNRSLGVIMQAVTLTALLILAYACGVTSYALIAAWILRPRPQRAEH
jgi:hypothetical protein